MNNKTTILNSAFVSYEDLLGFTVLLKSKLPVSSCSRLQDFIINFLKNIFTSVLAPQIAIASLGGSGMVQKENNCSKIKVKKRRKQERFISFQINIERLTNCKNYNLTKKNI